MGQQNVGEQSNSMQEAEIARVKELLVSGFGHVAPTAIDDVIVFMKADVAGEKHLLARQIQHIDDAIETVPRGEDRLDVEAVEGEVRGVSGTDQKHEVDFDEQYVWG